MVLTNIKDAELREALSEQGVKAALPINVLIKMRLKSSDAAAAASAVVERVAEKLQVVPQYRYRKLDHTLHVFAPTRFVRELVEQPEVLTAYSPARRGSALIPPVRSVPVDIDAVDRPMRKARKVTPRAGRTPRR
jgi:hypothetical protein